jgi:hypothetical protein
MRIFALDILFCYVPCMKTNKRGQYLSIVAGVPVGMINNAIKEIAKTRKVLKKRKVGKRK